MTINSLYTILFLFLLNACNNTSDSTKSTTFEPSTELTTAEPINSTNSEPKQAVTELQDLSGEHNLTLQWIGWNHPGTIRFTPMTTNKYIVEGSQNGNAKANCKNCYLTIAGTIEQVNPKLLRFTGKIESVVDHIQNGEPCIKEGTFDFLSTKDRKYWRCQHMDGCDGVTDYVDIYF